MTYSINTQFAASLIKHAFLKSKYCSISYVSKEITDSIVLLKVLYIS